MKLQAVLEAWDQKPRPRLQALFCTIAAAGSCFIDAVMRDDNRLPIATPQNLLNLRMFAMAKAFSLMTLREQKHLEDLIRINRAIAAGLGSKNPRVSRSERPSPRVWSPLAPSILPE